MILTCRCGLINRIPSLPKTRIRCGNCHHEFSPAELVNVQLEAPPVRPENSGNPDELADALERDELLRTVFGTPEDDVDI